MLLRDVIMVLTFVGLCVNVWFTHFRSVERLDATIVEYRFSDKRDPVERLAPVVDLTLVNRGSTAVRYLGATLHSKCPPDMEGYYNQSPAESEIFLVEPHSIRSVVLRFPGFGADKVRRLYAEAGMDTQKVQVDLTVAVTAMNSRGQMLTSRIGLNRITYTEGGATWGQAPEDSLTITIIPDGDKARRIRGGAVMWKSGGFGFGKDGSINLGQ